MVSCDLQCRDYTAAAVRVRPTAGRALLFPCRNFICTAGATFGSVATLPVGQVLHELPINGDNTLVRWAAVTSAGSLPASHLRLSAKKLNSRTGFASSTTTGAPAAAGVPAAADALAELGNRSAITLEKKSD